MSDPEFDFARRQKRVRLSVSVPSELVQWTKDRAKREGVTVSAVVELALRRSADRHKESA